MLTEQDIYRQDKLVYITRAVCPDLEPNFIRIFDMMRDGQTILTAAGQIIWDLGRRDSVLAGLFTAEVCWSNEARMLVEDDIATQPFQAIVLVKNPGCVNNSVYSNALTGAVNALVMVEDTLWCAAMENGRGTRLELIRRVTDLTHAGINYQDALAEPVRQLIHRTDVTPYPWTLAKLGS